jgi:hypothetical protein
MAGLIEHLSRIEYTWRYTWVDSCLHNKASEACNSLLTCMTQTFWLIDYLRFYVPLKNISHIWRRHHCRWRATKFMPMLGAQVEQGRIFIVPHLLWHGSSVFPVSSEGSPQLIASYDTHGDAEDLFYPGSSRGHRHFVLWSEAFCLMIRNRSFMHCKE